MSAPIYRLPHEVIEKILFELHDDPTATPGAHLPFLLTSKHFYAAFGPRTNVHLYASIFRASFDHSAPLRRLGDVNAPGLCMQLRANYDALACIRRGDIHAHDILQTFWTCFSMLLENDGKNRWQLDAAGLPDFVDRFVRERLYDDAVDGWPAENELNSLALWLLWLTTDEDRLEAESPAQRLQMIWLTLPFVLMPVRYPAYLAPHVYYTVPLPSNLPDTAHSFITAHGPYPQYRNGFSTTMPLYHVDCIRLGVPLVSIAAKLIYFSRRELFPVAIPSNLPRSRAHALQLGLTMIGPTQEDLREFNEHTAARLVPKSTWEWWSEIKDYESLAHEARVRLAPSARWDDDWNRLADCNSIFEPVSLRRTHYTPGLLSGLWQGRMLYPDENLYEPVMQTRQMPAAFSEQTVGLNAKPVFMRLREYHCKDVEPNEAALSGGIQSAWFRDATRFREDAHGLDITCQERTTMYDEYVVGGPDLHDESECRGCKHRGTSEMIFRGNDARYLAALEDAFAEAGMGDAGEEEEEEEEMDDDASDADVDMAADGGGELEIKRKCNGILDIVLVGETDMRHGQAWHHYMFYGRVREWDGLVALVRVPAHTRSSAHGEWVFTGYVVGGQNFVGNWRTRLHPGEPMAFEGAFSMSKRE